MNSKKFEPISNSLRKRINNEVIELRKIKDEKKIPRILQQKKEEFYQKLLSLDFDLHLVKKLLENGIPTPDVNLVIEIIMSLTKELRIEYSAEIEVTQNTQKKEQMIQYLTPNKVVKDHIKRRKFEVLLSKTASKAIEIGSELKYKEDSLKMSMIIYRERNIEAMRCNHS